MSKCAHGNRPNSMVQDRKSLRSAGTVGETLDTLGEDDWLVLSGSVPAGVPADIYAKLLERVRKNGVRTLLDTRAMRSECAALRAGSHQAQSG